MIDLNLKIRTPNNELKKLVGNDKFLQLSNDAFDLHENTCQCCGWKPKVEEGEDDSQFDYKKRHLVLEILELN